LGAHANDSAGGFPTSALVTFAYQIDGGPMTTALTIAPNSSFASFAYRPMDSGAVAMVGANGPLHVTGFNSVTKTLADTGLIAANTFLDKAPASGSGAGQLDTFSTAINGTGSQLVLTMTANLDFEAMAFDNIKITGVPEPSSMVLLGVGVLMLGVRRHARCVNIGSA
jgi:hypothetical protein